MEESVFKYKAVDRRLREMKINHLRLSQMLGASTSTVQGWFKGKNLPSLYYIAGISKVIGVPIDRMVNMKEVELYD